MIETIDITYTSISFAALGLAYIIASTNWRFRLAVNGCFKRDKVVQQRLKRLDSVRDATRIADEAVKARRTSDPIAPEIFGRRISA